MGERSAGVIVDVVIDRPPDVVWEDVRHIDRHVEWMADAEEIRFLSSQVEGVGTSFECDTKVGPLRLTDVMEITSWDPPTRMGVRHVGIVTGIGEFTLTAEGEGATRFRWEEELTFPWWMGGRLGAAAANPVLRRVWQRNLARLAARFGSDDG